MGTAFGVIFNPAYEAVFANEDSANAGEIFKVVPTLSQMTDQESAKRITWETLKAIKEQLG